MSTGTIAPYRSTARVGRYGFIRLLRAEWTKFRTVRGWVVGVLVAVLATLGVGLLGHDSCGGNGAVCTLPLGPGGEAVNGTAPGTAWLLLRLRDV
jgi:uncharacterized membrane protein (DUF441 family)